MMRSVRSLKLRHCALLFVPLDIGTFFGQPIHFRYQLRRQLLALFTNVKPVVINPTLPGMQIKKAAGDARGDNAPVGQTGLFKTT